VGDSHAGGRSVGQPTAVDDHRVIEQRAVAILCSLELVEQIRELLDVELVDLGDLLDLLLVPLVVRQAVMRLPKCRFPDSSAGSARERATR
jgi:hypothetical protein